MRRFLLDLRNRADFALRSRIRLRRPVRANAELKAIPEQQAATADWIRRLPWERFAEGWRGRRPAVADVGCRTFTTPRRWTRSSPPWGQRVAIHGIELDAWRRFTDLRTLLERVRVMCVGVGARAPGGWYRTRSR